MATVKFLFPLTGTIVGPMQRNDPPGQTRSTNDPDKSYTRILVQTGENARPDAEVTLTFDHEEAGSTVQSFVKSTAEGSLKRVTAAGSGFKYRTFFQFITKAAGVWTIRATVKQNGIVVAETTIRVQVVTTLWPLFRVVNGQEVDVDRPHGGTVHGYTWFRPVGNPVPKLAGHTIPTPDRNVISTPFSNRHDAVDILTTVKRDGRAPFSGRVTHKHLISSDPGLGHYVHIDGQVVTTAGTTVRYRACIAHLKVFRDEGDRVIIGQPLGKQVTNTVLHFALINLDDSNGPQPIGCILGNEALMPPAGSGDRNAFLALSSSARRQEQNWRPAGAYYASLRDNIRASLLQTRFGHP